jgi:DNA polymerase
MSILQRENILFDKFANLLADYGWSEDRIAIDLSKVNMEVARDMPNLTVVELEGLIDTCRSCYGKGLVTEHGPIHGGGIRDVDVDVLFIGQEAGTTEEKTKKVFTGPNSKALIDNLKQLGFGGPDCPTYAHNLVCCMPAKSPPKAETIRNCSPFLAELIYILQPNIIVTLGAYALSFMLGKSVKLQDYEGEILMQGRYIIVPMKHPSALHRMPEDKPTDHQLKLKAFQDYHLKLAGIKRVNERIKKLRKEGAVPERGDFAKYYEDENHQGGTESKAEVSNTSGNSGATTSTQQDMC